MDAVSRLLRSARIEASLDRRCLLGATTRMDVPAYPEREVPFHALLKGTCRLHVEGRVLDLRAGDVVLIPGGAAHHITTPGGGPVRGTTETGGRTFVTTLSERDGPAVIDLFCGRYSFAVGTGSMLFRSLPDPVHVSFGESADDEALRLLSTLMRAEARREDDGTAAILSALSTALLAMVLRTSRGAGSGAALWTAAGDASIASLIERVLAEPGRDWSIELMSGAAGMSRATFLRRFGANTGTTVGAFVTRARLMAAAELLTTTDATVASVATHVGYQSESAFSRAFRSATDMTPARFRRASATR